MTAKLFPNENVLPEEYPIYGDYFYVVDGKPYRSDWHGINVSELKARLNAKEIRRCNLVARVEASESQP